MPSIPQYLKSLKYTCQQCGWCCKDHDIKPVYEDIIRWEEEGRYDILEEIRMVSYPPQYNLAPEWKFMSTGGAGGICTFLGEDNKCIIHETKPLVCKHYPLNMPDDQTQYCKGCGKGRKISNREIKKTRQKETAAFLKTQSKNDEINNILLCGLSIRFISRLR